MANKTNGSLYSQESTIVYDWNEYDMAIKELSEIMNPVKRVYDTAKYMETHDFPQDRYLYLFETARKVADIIDVEKIENIPLFRRKSFVRGVMKQIVDYFKVDKDGVDIQCIWNPLASDKARFRRKLKLDWKKKEIVVSDKSKITLFRPLWYTERGVLDSICCFYHEYWHYMQNNYPKVIDYKMSVKKPGFEFLPIMIKSQWKIYRYSPLEREAWFVGYALMFFLNKKMKFKYADKKIRNLMEIKAENDVINAIKNIGTRINV